MGKRINLASGQRPFPKPWINIDIREQGYPVDIISDIRSLPMIEDNSCESLIAHHCLEHLDMSTVQDASKEWHRILAPGGKLAIFIPNAREIAHRWLSGQIDNFTYNVNMYGAYQGFPDDLHRWSYTYEYLQEQMGYTKREVPWSQVRLLEPYMMSDIVYSGANCAFDWWILSVEFIK